MWYSRHDAEEVDVCVVDGEVECDEARAPAEPEAFAQLLEHGERVVLVGRQDLHGARAAVRHVVGADAHAVQLVLSLVAPPEDMRVIHTSS